MRLVENPLVPPLNSDVPLLLHCLSYTPSSRTHAIVFVPLFSLQKLLGLQQVLQQTLSAVLHLRLQDLWSARLRRYLQVQTLQTQPVRSWRRPQRGAVLVVQRRSGPALGTRWDVRWKQRAGQPYNVLLITHVYINLSVVFLSPSLPWRYTVLRVRVQYGDYCTKRQHHDTNLDILLAQYLCSVNWKIL